MSLDTYIIEGGIGKCAAFTALVPKLAEKAGQAIQIVTPYIDCYANNPLVKMCYDENTIPLDDPRILASDNIHYCEPYKSNFIKGEDHLLKSYCDLFGVEYDTSIRPQLYTDHLKPAADEWLSKNNISDYIMVQFSGGQTPIGYNNAKGYTSSNAGRNYSNYFAQGIVNALKEQYPDITIIDCTLPNEPSYLNTVKCDQHWAIVHEMLKRAKGFISIDSCLQHFSASTQTRGVVIWGNTRWTQFGWMHNKNMSFHDKNRFNTYYKMDINDPRNIMVDPQSVLDTYINHVHDKKPNPEEIKCAHK